MKNINFTKKDIAFSKKIKSLSWMLEKSKNEFKLIFVYCKYSSFHKNIAEEVDQNANVKIHNIDLKRNEIKLFSKLQNESKNKKIDALMIFGIEDVENIDDLLISMNQVREEFRKHLPYPLVIWINDHVSKKLIRKIPDFESWGTKVHFFLPPDYITQGMLEEFGRKGKSTISAFIDNDIEDYLDCLSRKISARVDIELAFNEINKKDNLNNELIFTISYILSIAYIADKSYTRSLDYLDICLNLLNCRNNSYIEGISIAKLKALIIFNKVLCVCYIARKEIWKEISEECLYTLRQVQDNNWLSKYLFQLGQALQLMDFWEYFQVFSETMYKQAQKTSDQNFKVYVLSSAHTFLSLINLRKNDLINSKIHIEKAINNIKEAKCCYPIIDRQNKYTLAIIYAKKGNLEEGIVVLESIRKEDGLFDFPKYKIQILETLTSFLYQAGKYNNAFKIKRECLKLKFNHKISSFIGSNFLSNQAEFTRRNPGKLVLSQEKVSSILIHTRGFDAKQILQKIERTDRKLIIIHGKPGVGKTSILQGYILPSILDKNRKIIPIYHKDYQEWPRKWPQELSDKLTVSLREACESYFKNKSPKFSSALEGLKKISDNKFRTILIFDELEYLFYHCKESQYQLFYKFLEECLNIPYLTLVLSLRDKCLPLLLSGMRDSDIISQDILSKEFRCEINNILSENAADFLHSELNTIFDKSLIDRIVSELKEGDNSIISYEFQIVFYQLEKHSVYTLQDYKSKGNKYGLIKLYLDEVIYDCGKENSEIAKQILYFLTNKKNARLIKAGTSLSEILGIGVSQLDPVLYILMKSWILIQRTENQEKSYQLSLDCLPEIINHQDYFIKSAELLQTKQELRQSLLDAEASELKQLSLLAQSKFLANDELLAVETAVKVCERLVKSSTESNLKRDIERRIRSVIYGVKELNRLSGHEDGIWDIASSKVFNLLASASIDGCIKIWNFDGTLVCSFDAHRDWIWSLNFHPSKKLLASGGDDKFVSIWNFKGKQVATFLAHEAGVRSITFDPSGELLATSSEDGHVKLWSINGELKNDFYVINGGVSSISFSKDGEKIIFSSNINLGVIDLNQNLVKIFSSQHRDSVLCVKCSPKENIFVSGGADNSLITWDYSGKKIKVFEGHNAVIRSITFSSNGLMIASASSDGEVKLWDLDGIEIETFLGHGGGVRGVEFIDQGKIIVTGSADKTIRFWRIGGIARKIVKAHSDWVWGVSLSRNNQYIASVSADKTAKIWDFNGNNIKTLKGHKDLVRGISFSDDSKYLATGSADHSIKIWDVENGHNIKTFIGHTSKVWSVRFDSSGDKILSSSDDKTVKIWDVKTGKCVQTFMGHCSGVRSVRLCPDGKLIASGSANGQIIIWNTSGTVISHIDAHCSSIRSMAFNSKGTELVSASADGTVKLWNILDIKLGRTNNIKPVNEFNDFSSGVWSVKFYKNDSMIVTGSSDLTAQISNIDGTPVHSIHGHNAVILSVAISNDEKLLVTASADRTIRLWNIDKIQTQGSTLLDILNDGRKWLHNYNLHKNIDDCNDRQTNKNPNQSTSGDIAIELRETKQKLQDALEKERFQRDRARVAEVNTLNALTEALWLSSDHLGALESSLKAAKMLKGVNYDENLTNLTTNLLGTIAYRIQEKNRFLAHEKYIQSIRFSPKASVIATASVDGSIGIWDYHGKQLIKLRGHDKEVNSIRFDPNGKLLFSCGSDGTIKIWEVSNGRLFNSFQAHKTSVNNIAVDSTGKLIASAGADCKVYIWDLFGNIMHQSNQHSSYVNSVDFGRDGKKIISASADKSLILWDLLKDEHKPFLGHEAEVNSVQFSPDGKIFVSASADCKMKLWHPQYGELREYIGHNSHIKNVSFNHDGTKLVSASADGKVKLWNIDGSEIQNFLVKSGTASYVAFSNDSEYIAASSEDNHITIWSVVEKKLKTFHEYSSTLRLILFSPDSQLLAVATLDGTIKILTIDGKQKNVFKAHDFEILSIAFSPDSKYFATASGDHTVKLWSIDGHFLGSYDEHQTWVKSVCFSHDGEKMYSSNADGIIKCCKIDYKKNIVSFSTYLEFFKDNQAIKRVICSPDNRLVITLSVNDVVRVWNSKGDLMTEYTVQDVESMAISSDSLTIAFGCSDGAIRIKNLDGCFNDDIVSFSKHRNKVTSLFFDSCGETITSASTEGIVKTWDLAGNDEKKIRGPGKWLKRICLSPNANNIACLTTDNTFILWDSDLNFELEYLVKQGEEFISDFSRSNSL